MCDEEPPRPEAPTFHQSRARLAGDPQVKAWLRWLSGQPYDETKLKDLSDEQLAFVMSEVEKRRLTTEQARFYVRTVIATMPKIVQPKQWPISRNFSYG